MNQYNEISTLQYMGSKARIISYICEPISKGWNQYQFETYAPMITGKSTIPNGKQASFERNRNLFYVCCSRPKKRLFFFVSVPIDSVFRSFLAKLVGNNNIYTYGQYLEANLQ